MWHMFPHITMIYVPFLLLPVSEKYPHSQLIDWCDFVSPQAKWIIFIAIFTDRKAHECDSDLSPYFVETVLGWMQSLMDKNVVYSQEKITVMYFNIYSKQM